MKHAARSCVAAACLLCFLGGCAFTPMSQSRAGPGERVGAPSGQASATTSANTTSAGTPVESDTHSQPAPPQPLQLPKTVVLSVEPWTDFPGETGLVVRTNAYRLFMTVSDRRLVRDLPAFCEQALESYRTSLAELPPPPLKLDTYLMDSRAQWETLTRIVTRERADDYLQIRRGGFAYRGSGYFWDIGFADTLSITAHEGWHQYTQRTFKNRLPSWLEEGVATYHEGLRLSDRRGRTATPRLLAWSNTERFDRLREAVGAGRLLPLSEVVRLTPGDLLSRSEDAALDWYAQVWGAVHFLKEADDGRYAGALSSILEDAAAGQLWRTVGRRYGRSAARAAIRAHGAGAVLKTYLETDDAELDRAYVRFVSAVVAPGMRERILEGESPLG
ncbi:MAG: DUF1570 domain-containing protein [Planctomycetota bacterium]